jgi:hypothetical protein
MTNPLAELAADLEHAASFGAAVAGAGAVRAGAADAEVGMRTFAKASGIAVAGLGGLRARVGAVQRRGVYQESTPATATSVDADQIADAMASVAAAIGAAVVQR